MRRLADPVVLLLTALVAGGCEERDPTLPEPGDELLRLEASADSVGVGLDAPVGLTVSVTRDAEGDTCVFSATTGGFDLERRAASTSAVVGVDGRAEVTWFAPRSPGRARITASIGSVRGTVDVRVTPVPELEMEGLPDAMAVEESVLFRVRVPAPWTGQAVEVRATEGSLRSAGPVLQELDRGARILPLTDGDGLARVLFTAPAGAEGVTVVTASLFGTIRSARVEIQEP